MKLLIVLLALSLTACASPPVKKADRCNAECVNLHTPPTTVWDYYCLSKKEK